MEANELMIGDWVISFGAPHKIVGVRTDSFYPYIKTDMSDTWYEEGMKDLLEPIPLTPDILEKNFGRPYGVGWYDAYELKRIEGEGIYYVRDAYRYPSKERFSIIKAYNEEITFCSLKFAHELQHALRLAEIKKEIVL